VCGSRRGLAIRICFGSVRVLTGVAQRARCVLKDRRPIFAVECKSGEKAVSPAIRYFAERTPIPRFYQAHLGERHYSAGKVTVLPFIELCRELQLP
jgi:hypothetical protein